MHLSINFFLFFSLSIIFFSPEYMQPLLLSSSFETKLFELHSLPHSNLTFLGDSHLQDGAIAMTNVVSDAPRSVGMVFYNRPILFLDPHSEMVPSFSTKFAFTIRNIYGDEKASGDGLAFLFSPNNDFLGSPGYFGLVDSTDLTRNKFIAIEFDTKCDPMFQDPDDNHLGLDINSLFSFQLAPSSSFGVDLKSGNVITSWIDYKSDVKRLEVFLSNSYLKPEKPLLKVDIDLFDYLKENMFVGFSAATEGSMQLTRIEQWEFTILESSPPPPSPSLSELGRIFPNPSVSGHRHSDLSRLAIGITAGACSLPFIVAFGWFCWKMQTIKPSGGASCQEIRLSIPYTNPDEITRGFIIEEVLDNEKLIRVKTVKPIISLPATVCL